MFNLFLLIGPYLSQRFHTQRQADQVRYHPFTDTIHLGSYVLIKLILNYFKQLWIRGCKCGNGPTFLGGLALDVAMSQIILSQIHLMDKSAGPYLLISPIATGL